MKAKIRKNEVQIEKFIPELRRYVDVVHTGRLFHVAGIEIALFPIRVMAESIGRDSKTIKRWEREGRWPKSQWQVPDKRTTRWYSKSQIEHIRNLHNKMSGNDHGFAKSRHFPLDDFLKVVREMFYKIDAEVVANQERETP